MPSITLTIKLETELSPAQVEALFSRVGEPGVKITNIALVVKRGQTIYDLIQAQEDWIMDHGRNLEGYVARYGSSKTPDHCYGNGGEAIYACDCAELQRLRNLIR